MTPRERTTVWGGGGLVALFAGCYGWNPFLCALVGVVAGLAIAVVFDQRRHGR